MFGNLGPWELILILVIALVVIGPGKLPQVGKAIGGAVKEFRQATTFGEPDYVEPKPARKADNEPETE